MYKFQKIINQITPSENDIIGWKANMDITYWSVQFSSKRGGDGVKEFGRGAIVSLYLSIW